MRRQGSTQALIVFFSFRRFFSNSIFKNEKTRCLFFFIRKKGKKDATFHTPERPLSRFPRLSRGSLEALFAPSSAEEGSKGVSKEEKGAKATIEASKRWLHFSFRKNSQPFSTSTFDFFLFLKGETKQLPLSSLLFLPTDQRHHHARGPPGQGRPRRGHDHLLLHVPRAVKGGDDGAQARGARGENGVFLFFCHLFVLHLCVRSSSSMNEARASLRSGGEESRGRSVAARESCTLFPSLSLKCHARMPPSARHAHPHSFTLSASSRALSRLLDLETATTIIRDMPSEAPLPAN